MRRSIASPWRWFSGARAMTAAERGRLGYPEGVTARKHPAREEFEVGRRRSAFFSFLAGAGIGIIVIDTWVSHWFGFAGGVGFGLLAYGAVYGYETLMWRKHHGR